MIHAHPGLHEELAELVLKYLPRQSSVLDIGAGAGAFSLRLHDLGYRVTALDLDPSQFTTQEIRFRLLDINKGVAADIDEEFDAVCCIEVIEHVENPWTLLRDILRLVKPGGIAFVSTPHVSNFLSRLHFLRSGTFYSFGPQSLEMGHINPIHPYEFREIVARLGWKLIVEKPIGYLPVMDFGTGMSFRRLFFKVIANAARAFAYAVSSGESKRGWCLAFVLQRPT
jgi:2-polyprenyl-3-methyl-5-hydroxy-6-metoxy-1,4-benzoquinol methylase